MFQTKYYIFCKLHVYIYIYRPIPFLFIKMNKKIKIKNLCNIYSYVKINKDMCEISLKCPGLQFV